MKNLLGFGLEFERRRQKDWRENSSERFGKPIFKRG